MCGFVGFVNHPGTHPSVIQDMANVIRHRGPDDDGYFQDENVALGFRRLSIIDLEHGHQPLFNESNTKVLVFNGEIYNHAELREELIAEGRTFQTQSDSEVLVIGYDAWGKDLLGKLRGMYAFVIYDLETKRIFGARDIFGIKPLYYYQNGKDFFFGSEVKSFLAHPDFVKELNTDRLSDHLSFEFIPGRDTLFKNVYKIDPGEYFEYIDGELTIDKYHHIAFDIEEGRTLDQQVGRIRETLSDSVRAHKISDVEVGSFLSSGIDSSYLLNEAVKEHPVRSFSVGFEEEKYSELQYSTRFSESIDTPNTTKKISAEEYFDIIPKVQFFMDEPLSNPSAVLLYFLSQLAAKDVKVVLSGEGADELFGGYNTYQEAFVFSAYQKLPLSVRKGLWKLVEPLPKFKGRRFIYRGAQPLNERYYRVNYVFNKDERNKILKDVSLNRDSAQSSNSYFKEAENYDDITAMQYFDLHTWLPYDILHKADRMSMAHSLEVRVPFLDKELLKLAMGLPVEHRVTKEQTKVALRKAAAVEIPQQVANRPKLGFPSPLADWIRQDTFKNRILDTFRSETAAQFFNIDEIVKLVEDHCDTSKHVSNMQKIFTVYTFIVWYEQYFGDTAVKPSAHAA